MLWPEAWTTPSLCVPKEQGFSTSWFSTLAHSAGIKLGTWPQHLSLRGSLSPPLKTDEDSINSPICCRDEKKKKKKQEKQTWFHVVLDHLSPETTSPEGSALRQVYTLRVTLSLEHVFNH